ncbi:salicylate hydroxylase [Diaporthe amygdali]|uniref:salicylate hydroxylase n=1 Tax=Phomopsis amygdali TaxID=1214568 RepID=UPI0022FE4AF2|nr:salicylate hydroxylase [Diaporthe amygdali]KAJ0116957.1 salicylate hydroxylase [Diaporthe amygdali]
MPQKQPRIAIIGGGPAGLTLGALLHQRGIPFTVYELRPRPTDKELAAPSGMLDLHDESGLAAIRACGLYEEFLPLTGDCEEAMIVADKHGNILHSDQGGAEARPEIARHNIIKLFLSKIPAESIKYGTKVLSADRNSTSGEVTLKLNSTQDAGENISETFDLVIGADGAWSKIRPILSDVRPQSSGLQYLTLLIRDIATRYPHLASLVGKGSFLALGNKHGLDSHRAAQGSAQIYLLTNALGGDESKIVESLSSLSIPELKEHFLSDEKSYGDWGSVLKELITVAFDEEARNNGTVQIKPLAMLPIGHRWENKSGATLIGDAAHLMTPFAGEGVNLAMWDALDLTAAISKAWEAQTETGGDRSDFRTELGPRLKDFEEALFARAEEKAEETWRNKEMMFAEDGAKGLADLMASFYKAESPQ